jgi:alkylated DNA repair dioxygenase AlkB
MSSLFGTEPQFPPGFRYLEDFITDTEEQELLRIISAIELRPMMFQGYEAKRKTASFGHDWSFEKRVLTRGKPIPEAFDPFIEKATRAFSLSRDSIGELLVTEYPVGAVINWHRDAPPFDRIIGISLLSDCKFRLRPYDKSKQNRKSLLSFTVKRRSAYLMEGQARSDWEHSTAPVAAVRYSITMRTLE